MLLSSVLLKQESTIHIYMFSFLKNLVETPVLAPIENGEYIVPGRGMFVVISTTPTTVHILLPNGAKAEETVENFRVGIAEKKFSLKPKLASTAATYTPAKEKILSAEEVREQLGKTIINANKEKPTASVESMQKRKERLAQEAADKAANLGKVQLPPKYVAKSKWDGKPKGKESIKPNGRLTVGILADMLEQRFEEVSRTWLGGMPLDLQSYVKYLKGDYDNFTLEDWKHFALVSTSINAIILSNTIYYNGHIEKGINVVLDGLVMLLCGEQKLAHFADVCAKGKAQGKQTAINKMMAEVVNGFAAIARYVADNNLVDDVAQKSPWVRIKDALRGLQAPQGAKLLFVQEEVVPETLPTVTTPKITDMDLPFGDDFEFVVATAKSKKPTTKVK